MIVRAAIFVAMLLLPVAAFASNVGQCDVWDHGAVGQSVPGSDDTAAFNACFAQLATSGGDLYCSGRFHISAGFTISSNIVVRGRGAFCILDTQGADIQVFNFALGSFANGGLDRVLVYGNNNPATATANLVHIGQNVSVTFRDTIIWGGNFALFSEGVDSAFYNVNLTGAGHNGGALYTTGAGWYHRLKADNANGLQPWGVYIAGNGVGGGVVNHFEETDITGNYSYPLAIYDPAKQAQTYFTDSITAGGHGIGIWGAGFTSFANHFFQQDVPLGFDGWMAIMGSNGNGISIAAPYLPYVRCAGVNVGISGC